MNDARYALWSRRGNIHLLLAMLAVWSIWHSASQSFSCRSHCCVAGIRPMSGLYKETSIEVFTLSDSLRSKSLA